MNGTKTTETSCGSEHEHDVIVNIILILISSSIFVVGTIGNLLVVYIFQYKHNRRSVTEKLIVFLACADLLQSVLNPSLFAYLRLTSSRSWVFGSVGCKLIPGLQKVVISIAIGKNIFWSIHCVAVDLWRWAVKILDLFINLFLIPISWGTIAWK